MAIAVYPGSFDPFTRGHLDIATRAAALFDGLIVAVARDAEKRHMFSLEERVQMAREACEHLPNISVDSFGGLVVEYIVTRGARVMVKGVRDSSDLEREAMMGAMNSALAPDVETVLLIARPEYAFLSSSLLKHVHQLGGDISRFVTPLVLRMLDDKSRDTRSSSDA